jgi:hypothetical protein
MGVDVICPLQKLSPDAHVEEASHGLLRSIGPAEEGAGTDSVT